MNNLIESYWDNFESGPAFEIDPRAMMQRPGFVLAKLPPCWQCRSCSRTSSRLYVTIRSCDKQGVEPLRQLVIPANNARQTIVPLIFYLQRASHTPF